jgi:flagellar basal-body rod protein FlgG
MLEGLSTAAAGMNAQQQRLNAIANDLANANTTGYKHMRVGFRDLVYQQAGTGSAQGVRTGSGAAAVEVGRGFAQGSMQRTDRPLDVAVQGEGFIRVRLADGREGLTRDGGLHADGQGRLVTSTGAFVQPPMTLPRDVAEEDIRISDQGEVKAGARTLGRIDLVTVRSPQGLQSVGENTFMTTEASGRAQRAPAATTLEQGALEASNVEMAEAMTAMVEAQRSYELASKAIQTADQMMEIANGVKR